MKPLRLFAIVTLAALIGSGCKGHLKREVHPVDLASLQSLEQTRSEYLKAHLKSGELIVFSNWSFGKRGVRGEGLRFSDDRRISQPGTHTVGFAEIALFETNVQTLPPAALAMAVVTGVSAVITGMCIVNPKACFGSCPTFYVEDGAGERLVAEGFSDAISPYLEKSDVDALWDFRPDGTSARVTMKNEALETHVVRGLELLSVPLGEAGAAVETVGGEFRLVDKRVAASACRAADGDCLSQVAASDAVEWFSATDGVDLGSREQLLLEFDDLEPGEKALVLRFRQSLLTTFLFYSALSFLGEEATAMFALAERGALARSPLHVYEELIGQIRVEVFDEATGGWVPAGSTTEAGPLARNTVALELGDQYKEAKSLKVRLDVTRGNWRFDEIALASVGARVTPVRAQPAAANGTRGDVTSLLLDPEQTLVALPGDEYVVEFALPTQPGRYAHFLRSTGYYLEWMRDEWVAEEDPVMAAMMMGFPRQALRVLAPQYKAMEADMERVFWGSKYEKKTK